MGDRYGNDDKPTWREAADGSDARPMYKIVAFALLILVIVGGALAFALYHRAHTQQLAGDGRLITAPPGPYKVRPDEPGGMAVEGQGSTAFATSEGVEAEGRIDLSRTPEQPVTGRRAGREADANGSAISGQSVQATVDERRP